MVITHSPGGSGSSDEEIHMIIEKEAASANREAITEMLWSI